MKTLERALILMLNILPSSGASHVRSLHPYAYFNTEHEMNVLRACNSHTLRMRISILFVAICMRSHMKLACMHMVDTCQAMIKMDKTWKMTKMFRKKLPLNDTKCEPLFFILFYFICWAFLVFLLQLDMLCIWNNLLCKTKMFLPAFLIIDWKSPRRRS